MTAPRAFETATYTHRRDTYPDTAKKLNTTHAMVQTLRSSLREGSSLTRHQDEGVNTNHLPHRQRPIIQIQAGLTKRSENFNPLENHPKRRLHPCLPRLTITPANCRQKDPSLMPGSRELKSSSLTRGYIGEEST
ncbi:LOW QUALITY PROTEIN: hypothetical protein YC2023_089602 [Brassica napus]